MKEGFIVWNLSNCDCEFFGVFRSYDRAFKHFKKVIRNRYNKCPRGSYEEIVNWLIDNDIESGDDSIRITKFAENDGEWEGTEL